MKRIPKSEILNTKTAKRKHKDRQYLRCRRGPSE